MKITHNSNFFKMCRQGLEGAFIGMVGGAILGLLIFYLQYPLMWLGPSLPDSFMPMLIFTPAQPGLSGACFGALIGAIFGCLLSLKEITKK